MNDHVQKYCENAQKKMTKKMPDSDVCGYFH